MLQRKQNRLFLFVFVGLVIFLTVYLALQTQILFKKAAFGEVTVNFAPTTITKYIGEEFGVDLFVNSGDTPISAIAIELTTHFENIVGPDGTISVTRVEPEVGVGKPFTEAIADTYDPIMPAALIARKPTNELPRGTFKVATIYFKGNKAGGGVIGPFTSEMQIIGFNGQNEDVLVNLTVGTTTAYTISEQPLCRVGSCSSSIVLTNTLRSDGKYNINVSWTAPDIASPYFKVYRNIGAAVPSTHPDTNLVTTTNQTSITDTNGDSGFAGSSTVYYDVDTYVGCP